MEWLILIVLVPAIIVPVVLLWGFAGCGAFGIASGGEDAGGGDAGGEDAGEKAPPPPFNLKAKGVSTTQIDLTWEHNSAGGFTFQVDRQQNNGSWDEGYGTQAQPNVKNFSDKKVDEGKFYNYQVRATDSLLMKQSTPSNMSGTRTLKWEVPYDKPLSNDSNNFNKGCLVQRIDKSLLPLDGKARQVRITLRGSTAPLILERVFISQAALPGDSVNPSPDPWDSDRPTLTQVFEVPPPPNGPGPILLDPNSQKTLEPPENNYVLNNTVDLIIAFDIGSSGPARRLETGVGTSTCYVNSKTTEAGTADRTTGTPPWSEQPKGAHAVYLVEKIEVLTADKQE